ncbi:MAG: outer membrane beta-barrel protein [Desulfobacteraceae bacterium]|nr:outer membrane beta-barrel protein [Desulfobacteraceae bacterium]
MLNRVSILTLVMFCIVYGATLVTAADIPNPAASDVPLGQGEREFPAGQEVEGIGAEIFGERGGLVHHFVLFEETYTDNLFNLNTNKEDDFVTSVNPGLWIALPANREKLLEIGTTNTSPGGLNLSRIKPDTTRRAQGYFLYAPEFVYYADHSDHDTTNHKAEGLFQYNFDMGLSIDVVDQFNIRSEVNDNGISERLDEYLDNLFNYIMVYDPSEKLRFRVDYSNYDLEYEDSINAYRDRNDNSFSAYLFYRILPKTSVFVEYEFADISFDTNTESDSISDSIEKRYYTGLEWDVTAKTKGRIKIGYIDKDFDKAGVEDEDGFSYEIQTQHNFTPKRALLVNGFRRFNESTMSTSSTSLSTGLSATWLQRFTDKWSGTLNVSSSKERYKGDFTFNGVTDERDDNLFSIAPALRYEFREWLRFDLAYIFTQRDSNFKPFDFTNNTVFLRIDLSL